MNSPREGVEPKPRGYSASLSPDPPTVHLDQRSPDRDGYTATISTNPTAFEKVLQLVLEAVVDRNLSAIIRSAGTKNTSANDFVCRCYILLRAVLKLTCIVKTDNTCFIAMLNIPDIH